MSQERQWGRWCPDHGRWECTAHSRRPPHLPCHQAVGPGADVCEHHGGNAPRAKAAALARRVRAQGFGHYVPGRPEDILLQEIARTNGLVLYLESRLAQMPPEDLTWGVTEEREEAEEEQGARNLTLTRTRRAGPNVLLAWYERERRHLGTLCADAVRAGLAERMIELAKVQGEMLNQVLAALLDRLELTEAQRSLADTVIPELMGAVMAPAGG